MAYPLYQIGDYAFLTLAGHPTGLSEELEQVVRKGVDGTALVRTGRRGKPFQLTSRVDMPNKAQARFLFDRYQLLQGADPVEVIVNDINFNYLNCLFAVIDVEPVDIFEMPNATPGLNTPGGTLVGIVEARWTLLAVPIPT